MYSKPANAPTHILPSTLRLNSENAGISVRNGW